MKYTCILPKKTEKQLTELAFLEETTKADILRRALETYIVLKRQKGKIYMYMMMILRSLCYLYEDKGNKGGIK